MKPTLTLLALLFAGVIHLQAQEPTANETAWRALVTAKKTEAAASPEAAAIKDSIMAGATITRSELFAVASIAKANGGEAAYQTAYPHDCRKPQERRGGVLGAGLRQVLGRRHVGLDG